MISVIVPAYNAELYIERCIKSLLNQTYNNIEIIIIDDGSSDKTYDLCKKLKSENKDKKFIIKSIKNAGVSNARNLGIKLSKGDYIMFLDSDDYLDETYIESMYEAMHLNDYDYIISDFSSIKNNESKRISFYPNIKKTVNISFPIVLDEYIDGFFFNSIWKVLIKKELLIKNNIKFRTDMQFGEDAVFSLDVYRKSKKTGYVPICGYNYVFNSNSVTNIFTFKKRKQSIVDNYKVFENIRVNCNLSDCQCSRLINRTLEEYINGLVSIMSCKDLNYKLMNKTIYELNKLYSYYLNNYNAKSCNFDFDYKIKINLLKKNNLKFFLISTFYTRVKNKLRKK